MFTVVIPYADKELLDLANIASDPLSMIDTFHKEIQEGLALEFSQLRLVRIEALHNQFFLIRVAIKTDVLADAVRLLEQLDVDEQIINDFKERHAA